MTVIKKSLYKLFFRTVAFIITITLLASCSASDKVTLTVEPFNTVSSSAPAKKPVGITDEVRGIWIASVYNINFPSAPDLSADKLKKELVSIVNNTLRYNLNTIFFQVHPASDALYRSDIFPVSDYLFSGDALRFDPLDYMVKICHENGISLYAWVNPLRVSVSSYDSKDEAVKALPKGSPARDDSMTVFYGDGKLYYNCGVEAVRQLVADTVDELASNYDIDGIVFDDYFYPYPVNDSSGVPYKFDDSDTYADSKTKLSLEDWRRENVNDMIKLCYTRLKARDPEIQFGVAPFGIWQNNNGSNGGSDTSGLEAYSELYCDAVAWIKGKYVDFISPQLYWKCDSTSAPFDKLISFWSTVADGTGVDVLVSHGVYQYDDWNSPDELVLQVETARDYISYRGSILYGYEALVKNSSGLANDTVDAFGRDVYYYHPSEYTEEIVLPVDGGVEVTGDSATFHGYSDTSHPLTVNGTPVTRSHGGYFKCDLKLNSGENSFEFVCGDAKKEITIIKK